MVDVDRRTMWHAGVFALLGLLLCGCAEPGATRNDGRADTGARFFLSHAGYIDADMQPAAYATRLMASPDGEPYVLLILAGNAVFEEATARPLADEHPDIRGMVARFQRAYVVAIIDALPNDPSSAVLWALTQRLDDHDVGIWSSNPSEGVIVECESRPVREIAHDALVKRLHTDHGFDTTAWRKEIQKRTLGKIP